MAFAASGAANHSELPSPQHQQELHGKQLSWEQKCFLAHHVNFCKDFEALLESFNMHFDTDCDLDSLDHFLRKNCKDDEFLMYYQNADKYKWYFDDPLKTAHPIILLASRAMRTELRSFLAYHHSHGMSLPVLKENFNSTFPAEARESKEIATQLNFFGTNNQLRHSLSTFASRYSWHPEFNDTIQACNQAGNKAASRSAARDRLRRDKKTAETFANNEAALALQQQLLG